MSDDSEKCLVRVSGWGSVARGSVAPSRSSTLTKQRIPNLTKGTKGDLMSTVTDYEGSFRKPRMGIFDYAGTLV
jgi:hypothetical protein